MINLCQVKIYLNLYLLIKITNYLNLRIGSINLQNIISVYQTIQCRF
jgi:hypothetical protein